MTCEVIVFRGADIEHVFTIPRTNIPEEFIKISNKYMPITMEESTFTNLVRGKTFVSLHQLKRDPPMRVLLTGVAASVELVREIADAQMKSYDGKL
jgi:hypothetical protein